MINEEEIQKALVNPAVEFGKIIDETTCGLKATLKAAGCNRGRFFAHPQDGWFYYGFAVPEGTPKDKINQENFKPLIKCLVSKNFNPKVDKVTEETLVGLMKCKDRKTGEVSAKPCIVKATSKLVANDDVDEF